MTAYDFNNMSILLYNNSSDGDKSIAWYVSISKRAKRELFGCIEERENRDIHRLVTKYDKVFKGKIT